MAEHGRKGTFPGMRVSPEVGDREAEAVTGAGSGGGRGLEVATCPGPGVPGS